MAQFAPTQASPPPAAEASQKNPVATTRSYAQAALAAAALRQPATGGITAASPSMASPDTKRQQLAPGVSEVKKPGKPQEDGKDTAMQENL